MFLLYLGLLPPPLLLLPEEEDDRLLLPLEPEELDLDGVERTDDLDGLDERGGE